ncbi:unnamed protein product [Ilex paraguariensis]|uniref:C3H1-type domain-containing protein n=1 Tax=Ilex paraguariensis TaxID=185542 RepID=A0ABC8UBR9_9AQUA
MGGSHKSNRVSWASGVNLCQVRLFLSEESPSQIGLGIQDDLQAKTSWSLHSTGMGSDDNLPPGFEGTEPANLLKNRLSQVPVIKWRCPPRIVLDFNWRVVDGEESDEVDVQTQREVRVLEAVYPRPSAIPPNPSVLMGVEDSAYNDQNTALIPITPVEEEDVAADTSSDYMTSNTLPMSSQAQLLAPGTSASQCSAATDPKPSANGILPTGMASGVEPDVFAAAYTALNAVISNKNEGSLIDHDLLIRILSNPQLMENFVTNHGETSNPRLIPKPRSSGITISDPSPIHTYRTETVSSSLAATPIAPFYPLPSRMTHVPNPLPPPPEVLSASTPTVGAPVARDISYYKSLIQQHGEERQETPPQFDSRHNAHLGVKPESVNNPNPRDPKPKIMKPCIYFNSSRGCLHGANCSYLHDPSPQQQRVSGMPPEVQSGKRMKMDREITGL